MLVESVDVPIPLFVRPFPSTLTTPPAFATVSVVAVDDTILNAPLFAPVRNPAIVIEQGGVRQAEAIDAAGNVPVYTVFPPDAFATAVSRNAAGIIIGELRYTFDGSPR